MTTAIIGMLAETYVHAGASGSSGAIDLPVERERATQWPVIFGSGTKGALRSWSEEVAELPPSDRERLFGRNDEAGALLVSDARLLLLPVRSLASAAVWLTCPMLLNRLGRDLDRVGVKKHPFSGAFAVADGQYRGADRGLLTLEEREFTRANPGDIPADVETALARLIAAPASGRLGGQMAIVSDTAFKWFAEFALPVTARNELKAGTKKSNNLWYEETLPPDTVMYLLLADRSGKSGAVTAITCALQSHTYCRFGGNETLGQGWFRITVPDGQGAGGAHA